ncbi:MAG: pyridoxamine 5'-phosphate oxidase [Gammaproteobacteria bacterium]|nr:pyridoxamine 5'-phosphate oxidase [Gammaproteobacteria bacterium]
MPAVRGDEPFALVRRWLDEAASAGGRNTNAMALATVGEDGRPAVRMVLLKEISETHGYVVFYTNYRSRKARELERHPWAAAALYWPGLGRQLRLEGRVVRSPEDESDAYFATRPYLSQLNAWVSAQSEPLADGDDLERRAATKAAELGGTATEAPTAGVPRPPFWGGYRLWCDRVELWIEGAGRFHERTEYTRDLDLAADRIDAGPWRSRRLQP